MIKGKNTKPELIVRKFLFKSGLRYRINVKKLPGKPDIVLTRYMTVIFVHGCFWHGHDNCKYFVIPKTRTDWWMKKIERNKLLDHENNIKLKSMGWKVINIFQCELRKEKLSYTLAEILVKLNDR
jgi:DNA mismatch endonuclease (patch repair protein)